MQRKVAEQNRKPGGKKKKKAGAAPGDAAAPAAASSSGIHAAGMGLVNTNAGDGDWAKIPKKPGTKNKKAVNPADAGKLGFTSKFEGMALLEDSD